MYTKYWNLTASPFLNTDSEKLLYPAEQLSEGVARLYYLIDQERIAGMLTGPYGVGKTFLLSCLVRRTENAKLPLIRIDAIPNGSLPIARLILRELGVPGDAPTLADALMLLQQACRDEANRLRRHILLVDEAQYLADDDGFYLVHYLCNLRLRTPQGEKPLFTIILCGTPELADSVRAYESLQRRIQLFWTLRPLDEKETIEYIQQHIRESGGDMWCFSLEALKRVHLRSGGVPRSINNICDTALMLGYAAKVTCITPDIVDQAADDTGLTAVGQDGSNNQEF